MLSCIYSLLRGKNIRSEKSCIDKIFHSSNPISVTLFCQEAAVPAGPEAGFELLSTSYRGHGKQLAKKPRKTSRLSGGSEL